LLGCQPAIFDGDRTRADDFIEEVKGYFRVNAQVPDMQSWLRKIAFTLTLIKGPLVANWVQTMGEWFDTLQPHNDTRGTWQTFLDDFRREYQDTQSKERARIAIENLRMKWPLVDQYIQDFEHTAIKAGYQIGDPATTRHFLKGLPRSVALDILKPPVARGYEAMKQRAIESVNSQRLIQDMFKGGFPSLNPGQRQTNYRNQQGQFRPPQSSFNSSNAPRRLANVPIPMDLDADRARAPRTPNYGWRTRAAQGRTQEQVQVTTVPKVQESRPPRREGNCFECGQPGHFARNCPLRKKRTTRVATTQLVDWEPADNHTPSNDSNKINAITSQIAALTTQERELVAAQFGLEAQDEDEGTNFLDA
jgi:Retrotransposon gag protein/Zinc knuckle